VYRVLVGKLEGKRPLGRPRHRWVENIRIDQWGEGCIGSLWGNRRERDHWGDRGVDGWILGWICGERGYIGYWWGNRRERTLGRPRCRWVDIRMDLCGEVVYRVLVGKPEGKRPLGRHRRRLVDNIWMDQW